MSCRQKNITQFFLQHCSSDKKPESVLIPQISCQHLLLRRAVRVLVSAPSPKKILLSRHKCVIVLIFEQVLDLKYAPC